MLPNEFFEKSSGEEVCDNEIYRMIVGSLNYFSIMTRPDISYSVGCASQFLEFPSESHYVMLKRIVRYLAGTSDVGLVLGGDSSEEIVIFSDATWASDPYDRKSTSGMVVKLGGSVIAWFSRKQKSVALSSMEAELIAVTAVAKEISWIIRILRFIGVDVKEPVTILEDNQSCIKICQNPEPNSRNKHISLRVFWICEKMSEGLLDLKYIESRNNLADGLTKALPYPAHQKLMSKLGLSG
jgi:hypothetical protein